MTTSHTPGPWKAEEERGVPYLKIRGTKLGERFKIANVLEPVYEGSRQRESDETIANARLISAAPELLDALKVLTERIAYYASLAEGEAPNIEQWAYTDGSTDVAKARAAIAKATGEAQ